MCPDRDKSEREETETGREFNAQIALEKATEEPYANLIADIVGHPNSLPSIEELGYLNPSLDRNTIQNHLQTLEDIAIVKTHPVEETARQKTYPDTYYGLTETARQLFDENNLFPQEPWQREYAAVDKTERIQELEQISRPQNSDSKEEPEQG